MKEGDTYRTLPIEELHATDGVDHARRIKANILKQLPKKKRLTRTVHVEDKTVAAELRADLEGTGAGVGARGVSPTRGA